MILGIDKLHDLVKEKNLLENLSQRELENPEGAGFDLRIGELHEVTSGGFLGVTERETPGLKLIANKDNKIAVIEPGKYYLMTTMEKVNTPKNLMGLFRPRTTLFRSGIALLTGNCSPGYCGKLSFGMINLSQHPFKLEVGARVLHAMFHKIDGSSNLYRGQWQGGRKSTEKRETQI